LSDVEAVEDAMKDGGKNDTEEGDENEATEKGIACGKEFGGGGGEFETVNGAHTAHEHRGFDDGIGPWETADFVISEDACCQSDGEKKDGHTKMLDEAEKKYGVGGEGLAVVFVREDGVGHRKLVAGKRGGEKSEVSGMGKKLGGAGFEPAKA
jgi:hypothetical protein